jgi:hypothetical protein
MVFVTLGTGVGGGIILNGSILAGSNGAGGEIGHIFVNELFFLVQRNVDASFFVARKQKQAAAKQTFVFVQAYTK